MRLIISILSKIIISLVTINSFANEYEFNYESFSNNYSNNISESLTMVITTNNHIQQKGHLKEIEVKFYYDWTNIPSWRLKDSMCIFYDSSIFDIKPNSFSFVNYYYKNGEFISNSGRDYTYGTGCVTWLFALAQDSTFKMGGEISKMNGYGKFTLEVKEGHKEIFTNIYGLYFHSKFVDYQIQVNNEKILSIKGNGQIYSTIKKIPL